MPTSVLVARFNKLRGNNIFNQERGPKGSRFLFS